ncbi:MHS family MFS transporter [Nocardioides albidus]|uniref:MHS family MFS transporter n=1 Tax=Nocardioides albidus TaxID=1517589 RepID=A0A5C4VNM0_9ACTN|nr:MFS transporter [Nocardioides albidus]TNM37484.1 MHS family MFS transporter [Nocardioides albidus]
MTTTLASSPPSPTPTQTRRLAIGAGAGTSLEFFDFSIYTVASALIFPQIFFSGDTDPWFASFMSLATYTLGYVVAPLGAIVMGWYGDKHGRRKAMLITFFLMGTATVLMGLLPTYSSIGIAAPVLLVLLRLVHGFSRGGELGGASVLAVEHAPPTQRAAYGAFVALGSPFGAALANLSFVLVFYLPAETVTSWAWRIPFLFGAAVLVIGIWARKRLEESPVFEALKADRAEVHIAKVPVWNVLRDNWRRLALAAGANMGLNAVMFVLAGFMLSYAASPSPKGLGLEIKSVLWCTLPGLLVHAVTVVAGARLSDRLGRKPVMLTATVAIAIYMLFLFPIAEAGSLASWTIAIGIGFALTGFLFGPLLTYLTELFTPEQRQSGAGIAYQIGAVLGGGLSPSIANRLIEWTGQPSSVGYYLAGGLCVTLVCLLLLPETAPVKSGGQRVRQTGPEAGVLG